MQNEGPAAQVLAPRPGVTEEAVRRSELGMPAAGVIDGVATAKLEKTRPRSSCQAYEADQVASRRERRRSFPADVQVAMSLQDETTWKCPSQDCDSRPRRFQHLKRSWSSAY